MSWSQIEHPKASPFSSITQNVGLSEITVDYSRPATKGRKIFGFRTEGQPGLVPYGRIWRVGANESTKITFDSDVTIQEKTLPKGTYALYAFPEKDTWEIVFHKNTTHWGDGRNNYDPQEDALRIKVKPIKTLSFQENFQIDFDNITHNSLDMVWHWAHTKITVPMYFDTKAMMTAQIVEKLKTDLSAQTLYEIARYYQEQGIEYPKALQLLNNAIEKGGDTYYFHRVKSLVQAALEDYESAIGSAQKSLELAEKQGKDEFVRMNRKNIKKWQATLKNN
ncbi:DUF2911 domain-containing protein [Maribacter sp. 2210JD10-5]|uniref:DUF2911 domain-containing protein n=1 Tax=Maribacter sp. 2210JD10-5 TaxID=3386272 RepID=UPI0039BCA625